MGDATEEAARAFGAVREKIEDYFTRCSIAGFDERAAMVLNGDEKAYEAMEQRAPLIAEVSKFRVYRWRASNPGTLFHLKKS